MPEAFINKMADFVEDYFLTFIWFDRFLWSVFMRPIVTVSTTLRCSGMIYNPLFYVFGPDFTSCANCLCLDTPFWHDAVYKWGRNVIKSERGKIKNNGCVANDSFHTLLIPFSLKYTVIRM
jgi:hypothetical protein